MRKCNIINRKIRVMKKNVLIKSLVALSMVALCVFISCQQNDADEKVLQNKSIIDFDVTKSVEEQTTEESKLAAEAYHLMDSHITIENGQFVLSIKNGASIGLSERVFEFYKSKMDGVNQLLSFQGTYKVVTDHKTIEVWKDSSIPLSFTKSAGGVTKIEFDWNGFDLYLSQQDCNRLSQGATLVSIIGALAPDPTVSKVVATVGALCSLSFSVLASEYPGGVIITADFYPAPIVGCISIYTVKGQ